MHVEHAIVELGEIFLELRVSRRLLGHAGRLVRIVLFCGRARGLVGDGADGLGHGLLVSLGRGSREVAELGELKLEVDVRQVADGSSAECLSADGRRRLGCHERHPLLVMVQLSGHALDLSAEQVVLMVSGFRSLFQLLDLGLKILEMLLLSLSEGTLSSSVLSLALLQVEIG